MKLSIINRNQAFLKIIEKLPKKRKEVYNVILQYGKCTAENIAKKLNCRPSDISGRITELKAMMLIKEVLTSTSQRTQNAVTVYSITTDEERIDLIDQSFIELRTKKERIENDLNTFKGLSQESRRILLKETEKTLKQIKWLKKWM